MLISMLMVPMWANIPTRDLRTRRHTAQGPKTNHLRSNIVLESLQGIEVLGTICFDIISRLVIKGNMGRWRGRSF